MHSPIAQPSLEDAAVWQWTLNEHNMMCLHSGIGYVTQAWLQGRDQQIISEHRRKPATAC